MSLSALLFVLYSIKCSNTWLNMCEGGTTTLVRLVSASISAGRGDDFGGAETREVLDGFFAEADISARYYDGFAREVGGRDGRFEGWLCVDFRQSFCSRSIPCNAAPTVYR